MRIISALWLTMSLIMYCYLIPIWLGATAFIYLLFKHLHASQAIAYAASASLFPVMLIFMEYLAWKAFDKYRYDLAMVFATVPLLLLIPIWMNVYHYGYEFWWPWSF